MNAEHASHCHSWPLSHLEAFHFWVFSSARGQNVVPHRVPVQPHPPPVQELFCKALLRKPPSFHWLAAVKKVFIGSDVVHVSSRKGPGPQTRRSQSVLCYCLLATGPSARGGAVAISWALIPKAGSCSFLGAARSRCPSVGCSMDMRLSSSPITKFTLAPLLWLPALGHGDLFVRCTLGQPVIM